MKTIYKYPLKEARTVLQLPSNSEILCIQLQNKTPTLWAIVENDTDEKEIKREILCFGTGQSFENYTNLNYIGTLQKGGFVFHAFENLNYEY